MNILGLHRAASGVAPAHAAESRATESYRAVAARVQAQAAGAVAAPALPTTPVSGLPFANLAPPGHGGAAVPPRPPGVPGDFVYRGQMWLPPAAAAIYDAQVADAQAQAAQVVFWHASTNPAQIEGLPLEQWSTEQLQAGLAYYKAQLADAVPQSNQWLELTDRINSLQANLDGNRSPWNWSLSQAVNYWSTIGSRVAST